jgi:hypothetical protein
MSLLSEPVVLERESTELAGESSGLALASESSGLALASGSMRVPGAPRGLSGATGERFRYLEPGLAEPTFADVLRSAPSVLTALPTLEPTSARPAQRRQSWLPSLQSMLLVAAFAFVSGVTVAALWGRVLERPTTRASTIVFTAPPRLGVPAPLPVAAPAPLAASRPVAPVAAGTVNEAIPSRAGDAVAPAPAEPEAANPMLARERPVPGELARAFRRVAPDVRRCLGASTRAVDVEVLFEGASGQVAGVNLHTSRLKAGEVECITHALRQMQVPAFRSAEHKLAHRFAF